MTTQCSGDPCSFNSVLDFVFAAGTARDWQATSEIIVRDGDLPDDATTSDHRPVKAVFEVSTEVPNQNGNRLFLPNVIGIDVVEQPTAMPTATDPPSGPCSCASNLYNCSDFNKQSSAQACFDYCVSQGRGDIHRLDADNDGLACESLPSFLRAVVR